MEFAASVASLGQSEDTLEYALLVRRRSDHTNKYIHVYSGQQTDLGYFILDFMENKKSSTAVSMQRQQDGHRVWSDWSEPVGSRSSVVGRMDEAATAVRLPQPVNIQTIAQPHNNQILVPKAEIQEPCGDMDCIKVEEDVGDTARSTASDTVSPQPVKMEINVVECEEMGEPVSRAVDQRIQQLDGMPTAARNTASADVCSDQSPGIAGTPLDSCANHATAHNTQNCATKTVIGSGSEAAEGVMKKPSAATVVNKKNICSKGTTTRGTTLKMAAAAGERMKPARASAKPISNNKKPQSPGPGPSKSAMYVSVSEKPTVQCAKKRTQATCNKQSTGPVKTNADMGGKVHKCKECDVCYGRPSLLEKHMKTNHTVTAHQCHICNKCFSTAKNVKMHISTAHHGTKRFQCSKCVKSFGQKGNLDTHVKSIHEGEKFECEECGKQFSEKSSLRRHALMHTGEKPHVCEICGKGFSSANHLTDHRHRHLQIKPHQCPVCHMTFVTSTEMKKHMRCLHPPQ